MGVPRNSVVYQKSFICKHKANLRDIKRMWSGLLHGIL